ncbi:hypothetical protein RU95_GL001320 [Enterococcus avium]|nr:hypothetical protein RU95_GL001320 [Enterococcus avium]
MKKTQHRISPLQKNKNPSGMVYGLKIRLIFLEENKYINLNKEMN